MAVLGDSDRVKIWAHLMRGVLGGVSSVNKAALRDAVNAVDDWADSNDHAADWIGNASRRVVG
jgi:hypothetical protein